MFKVTKEGKTQLLHSEVQLAAFKANGWEVVADESKPPKAGNKPKPPKSKPDEPKPDEPKPDEPKPDEPKPDEPKLTPGE